ncbi:hypothetical protein BH10ACT3_BH10ACT3_20690 [soil metagenome]
MTDDLRPQLIAEWRLVLTLADSSVVAERGFESEKAARVAALRHVEHNSRSTWEVQRRLVSPWMPWTTPVEVVDRHPAESAD